MSRPSAALAPFVRVFRIVETEDEATRTLLPDTGVVIGFRFSGSAHESGAIKLPDATIAGMRRTARIMCTSAGGRVLLATLHPGAAPAFFDEPIHEIFGGSLGLDSVVPRADVQRTHERVMEATTPTARVAVMESFLLARLDARRNDLIVDHAVRAIRETNTRIGDLARTLGLSRDRLEKRFRRAVGATPKQLASIIRVNRAIALHQQGASLSRLALDAGFYDQAHFTRELRAVTGQAPQRFFRDGRHC